MIFKRVKIILLIAIFTSLIGASLILIGNRKKDSKDNEVNIYSKSSEEIEENKIDEAENSVSTDNQIVNIQNDEQITSENILNVNSEKVGQNTENKIVNKESEEIKKEEKSTNEEANYKMQEINKNQNLAETESIKEVEEKIKEDVYTFEKNDVEIQKMISIAKRIIKENKDNRCNGLVDNVDNINFVIGKAGNLFYPLFDYRIENIVIDNFYPEFYVYAEDVYLNGEYLRTEYYFN